MRIAGIEKTRRVFVNNRELRPERSLKVYNHSPDGFAWGYAGSGPAQLALAILLYAGFKRDVVVALYQIFKEEYVANWKGDFSVEIDVDAWVASKEKGK